MSQRSEVEELSFEDMILPEHERENPFMTPSLYQKEREEDEVREKEDQDEEGVEEVATEVEEVAEIEEVEEVEEVRNHDPDDDYDDKKDIENFKKDHKKPFLKKHQRHKNKLPKKADLQEASYVADPEVLEEIALWQYCAPDELYMLLKDDPARFLPVLERDRELAQKHGCLVTREEGKLRIKFRIYPEDRWTECGYFEDFDDKVIYEEFAEAVQRSLNTSRNKKDPKTQSRAEYLKTVRDNPNDQAHIAGELDRQSKDKKDLSQVKAEQMMKDDFVFERQRSMREECPTTKRSMPVNKTIETDRDSDIGKRKANNMLDAYLRQVLSRMKEILPNGLNLNRDKRLDELICNLRMAEKDVPETLLEDYHDLITDLLVASNDPFYKFMVYQKEHNLPRYLEPIFDGFMSKMIHRQNGYLGSEWTHERICGILGLPRADVDLLHEYNIDLRDLWNQSRS